MGGGTVLFRLPIPPRLFFAETKARAMRSQDLLWTLACNYRMSGFKKPMATLFRQQQDCSWSPTVLEATSWARQHGRGGSATVANVPEFGLEVVAFQHNGVSGVALLVDGSRVVFVNGEPLVTRIRVCTHKDEILVAGTRFFFSAESVPELEIFHAAPGGRRVQCPVCRRPIEHMQQVVRCAGCQRLFHQIDASGDRREKHCWTYHPACPFCDHPTSLSGEATWTPEVLERDE